MTQTVTLLMKCVLMSTVYASLATTDVMVNASGAIVSKTRIALEGRRYVWTSIVLVYLGITGNTTNVLLGSVTIAQIVRRRTKFASMENVCVGLYKNLQNPQMRDVQMTLIVILIKRSDVMSRMIAELFFSSAKGNRK